MAVVRDIQQFRATGANIEDIRTDWLRIPLAQPIADSTHVLRFKDLILVEIRAGDSVGTSYMLSFDYAPTLLRGIVAAHDGVSKFLPVCREAIDVGTDSSLNANQIASGAATFGLRWTSLMDSVRRPRFFWQIWAAAMCSLDPD
jgi:hypothetical protein